MERKLRSKHRGLTLADVRAAIQWPAVCASAWDDHPEYGRRLMAIGNDGRGEIVCYLTPIPYWDEDADTWGLYAPLGGCDHATMWKCPTPMPTPTNLAPTHARKH